LIQEIVVKEEQEAVIRQNEARIKAIMEETDEGLWEWDLTTGRIEYDENWQRILGYEPGEISFNYYWLKEHTHPAHRHLLIKALRDYVEGVKKYYELEYRIKTKAGEWRWVWTRGISLTDNKKNTPFKLTGTNRDITVYRETQEALQASVEELAAEKSRSEMLKIQKLESLGILAGGIAHDFNNLLAAILSNVQLVSCKLTRGMDGSADLKAVENATLKAANLTKQLLAFSKGGTPVKQTAVLSEIITETVEFVLRGSSVRCEYNFPADLWAVEIDGGQISQVIQNLVINACQAMPGGGVIKVSVSNQVVPPGNEMMLSAGNYVKVEIKDQGKGIPAEDLTRIFDPYFTTKKKGNGLGLSSCYYILKNHDGYIGVRSQVGTGSTFYFYLPALLENCISLKKADPLVTQGHGRILLMDDEPLIRDSVREFLESCGYQVLVAEDGWTAVGLYKQMKEALTPFDVVIMDLTIPGGMGGKEAVKHILSLDPQARVIVSSGYSNDPVMSDYQRYGFCNVVTKPYRMEELSEKIKESMMLPETLVGSGRR
jgi:PAS domain S-box-containing protein